MFVCRKDLLEVKGIGPKVFEQCAGFLRVGPINKEQESSYYSFPKTDRLDRTDVHPESYDLAKKILKKYNLKGEDIGRHNFTSIFKRISNEEIREMTEEFDKPEQTVSLVVDALAKPLNYDFRNEVSKAPLFKKGLMSMSDLAIGANVTGCVRNVCDFGAFVDIGVGHSGLVHKSKMNGLILQIGDTIEVSVQSLDFDRKRIGLLALSKV